MSWKKEYEQKLTSVKEAAKLIKSGDRCLISCGTAVPVQLVEAVTENYQELENVDLISGMALYPFKCLQSPEFVGKINFHTVFLGPVERTLSMFGNVNVNSVTFSKLKEAMRDTYKVNVLMADVSLPDEDGYLYYGPLGVAINGSVSEYAEKIIVQVNKYQPKVVGEHHRIHVSKVDCITESDHKLAIFPQPEIVETDRKIAEILKPEIKDGSVLQIGVGGLSNAVGYSLTDKKDLSIHTEMLTDSMVYLAKEGVITGDIVAGFALGNQEVNEFASEGKVKLIPASISNDPYVIGKHDNFISINACLMADLTGQICSESIGFRQYSCTGGQTDFVRGASLSKGGKSFLCLASTVMRDGKVISTITTTLPAGAVVTTPRSDVMYVVTEFGIADVYNKPISERVKAMISIAHPDFREQLRQEAIDNDLLRG